MRLECFKAGRLNRTWYQDMRYEEQYYADGQIALRERWYKELSNNLDKSFCVWWYKNSHLRATIHRLTGVTHREDGPAYQRWYDNGRLMVTKYYINDQLHRETGPAMLVWSELGQLCKREYYRYGKLHRDKKVGPAREVWDENGQLRVEEYRPDGGRYRYKI